MNVGDRVNFFARVRGSGMSNTASAVWLGKGPEIQGAYTGRIISFNDTYRVVNVMTNRGHVFQVAL